LVAESTVRPAYVSRRPLDGHCLAGEAPEDIVSIERLLSNFHFSSPTDVAEIPGAAETSIYVTEKSGRITKSPLRLVVPRNEIIEIAHLPVNTDGDGGVIGLALHPDYDVNRRLYLTYTTQDEDGTRTLFLSEFTANSDHTEWNDERVILAVEQESRLHYGGAVRFGPDGMLYMGFGDDGLLVPGDTRREEAQNPRTLIGTIIRIDVDRSEGGRNYAIPDDNPSINGLEPNEVFAYGFRNPWRMSFDKEPPHQLYVGDVGENAFEEVNAVVRGGNHGWPECEGLCESSKTGFVDPLHEYAREEGRAVIGGQVYRGQNIPGLQGQYIYAGFIKKSIYALDIDTPSSNGSFPVTRIATTRTSPIGFFTDSDNEMYIFGSFTGGLYRIVENSGAEQSTPPELLSDTGCFSSLSNGNPISHDWIQDYHVNQRFWTDGAKKDRYFSIPENTLIDVSDPMSWTLPTGGVTIKHLRLDDSIFETRFIVRHDNGDYAGYTYAWNDDLSNAVLVDSEGIRRQIGELDWGYPSRAQCVQCHTEDAGGTLSLESSQLNRTYPTSASLDNDSGTAATNENTSVNQIDFFID